MFMIKQHKQQIQIVIYILIIIALLSIIPLNHYFSTKQIHTLTGNEETTNQQPTNDSSTTGSQTTDDTTRAFWKDTVLPVIIGIILVLIGVELFLLTRADSSSNQLPHSIKKAQN